MIRCAGEERRMEDVDVTIVGAGPTGLALACELRLAGVSCRVLERRTDEPNITRAFAVHARTLELLDARGLGDELVPQGIQVPGVQPAPGATLSLTTLPTRYPMVLIVAQSGTEKMLARRARELGAQIVTGAEVTGLDQDADGVTLRLADGRTTRSAYAVGTDGAHSAVRRLAGIDFAGKQYQTHIILADVTLSRPPKETLFGVSTHKGLVLFVPFGDEFRAIVWDRTREDVPLDEPVTLEELRASFHRIAGDDYGMGEPRWRTRFLSERRQAERYRAGRVFLAGDAAHVHSPVGGQGMNTGIQDAMNLGWKLAADLQAWAAPGLLDTYQAERHPVGESVLRMTDALYKLVLSGSPLGVAMRRVVIRAAVGLPPVRRQLALRLSGIGIKYAHPDRTHPWAGRRMPDLEVTGGRLYEALREGKFVLIGQSVAGYSDRVVAVQPVHPKPPATVLVRPDGYVAWAAGEPDADPSAPLHHWCGTPTLESAA
jgi:2-polyprenyl-6-methoxyphenol hydroxylase-like FAD-dependent oxidoreductase